MWNAYVLFLVAWVLVLVLAGIQSLMRDRIVFAFSLATYSPRIVTEHIVQMLLRGRVVVILHIFNNNYLN